jgi:hypothetical protein
MKRKSVPISLFLLAAVLLASVSCNRGNRKTTEPAPAGLSASDTATIMFTEYEHDFGKVIQGEKVAFIFTYENRGNAPLVISSASTSCGCTVSKYSRKPVPPGGIGTMEVEFDSSGRNGKQSKVITVRSNATKPIVLLRITGEVINDSNN